MDMMRTRIEPNLHRMGRPFRRTDRTFRRATVGGGGAAS
jgi:hypothetical protein